MLDRDLEDIYEILPFIETQLKPQNVRSLVIIANDVKGNALASFIETRKKGLMNILCVKAPAFGKYKSELLHDIAVMCGGQVIDENMQIKDATFDYLGFAKVVKASRDSTVILENKGSVKAIKQRIASIKLLLKDPDSDLDKEKLQERLSKMTGGVYVIKTGGATEVEMAERKERVEDAILATRAAIQGGIIPGGEVALLTASNKLIPINQDEEYAYRILKNAINSPFEKLLSNAGMDAGYYKAKLEDKSFGWGVDVMKGEVVDLIKVGIVDPTRVITEALRSALSVAILIVTSDGISVVVEDESKT